MKQAIKLDKIRLDGGTQPREKIDEDIVKEYAERKRAGDIFPPVEVFQDGKDLWLADGFHRFHGVARAGEESIDCNIRKGTKRDAILFSVGANSHHGLRRTNADKRNAVAKLLQDEEWSKKSDRWIAEQCAVSNTFVGELRNQLATVASSNGHQVSTVDTSTRTGRDGKNYPSTQTSPESVDTSDETGNENGESVDTASTPDESDEPETTAKPVDGMDDWNRSLESWARSIVKQSIESLPNGPWMDESRRGIIESQLRSAANTARAVKGEGECPYCDGFGCKKCRSTGFLNKADLESAPVKQ